VRREPNLNGLRLPRTTMQLHLFVDEPHKTLYSIQDGLNL
jgi:hypothetical protein